MLSLIEKRIRNTWIAQTLPGISSHLDAIKPDLEAFRHYLQHDHICESTTPQQIINYVFAAEGKKLRPCLFFFLCKLLGYQEKHLLPLAAVSEYVHTASLLHDDVLDSTTLRRRQATVHSKWGDKTSILVGDIIYAHASKIMAATGSLEIVTSFAQAIKRMSEGELLQLENLYCLEMKESVYFRIIGYKTAELLASTCFSASVLASQEKDNAKQNETLYHFGYKIGIAFQLIDDALDYCGENIGKDTLVDFANGKVTMPLLLLYSRCDKQTRMKLQQIASSNTQTMEELATVRSLVHEHATIKDTVEQAHKHTSDAISLLAIFPSSPIKANLIELVNLLLTRVG